MLMNYFLASHLGKLINVSVKVPEELRKLMEDVDVSWSEYLREVIEARIRAELAEKASKKLDEIRRKAGKVSTEEIMRWIREDRLRGR